MYAVVTDTKNKGGYKNNNENNVFQYLQWYYSEYIFFDNYKS